MCLGRSRDRRRFEPETIWSPISPSQVNYDLRPRRHNRALPKHPTRLIDANSMCNLDFYGLTLTDFNFSYCILHLSSVLVAVYRPQVNEY